MDVIVVVNGEDDENENDAVELVEILVVVSDFRFRK